MQSGAQTAPTSKGMLWAGRVISGPAILFLVFDGVTKVLKVPAVMKAAAELKFSDGQIVAIGIILLICTAIYAIPRTAILGPVLLTGYLGGAISIQMHAGNPIFETLFPGIFGVLVWSGIFFRDSRLRMLIPMKAYSRD
jgi:hypothetical protein